MVYIEEEYKVRDWHPKVDTQVCCNFIIAKLFSFQLYSNSDINNTISPWRYRGKTEGRSVVNC